MAYKITDEQTFKIVEHFQIQKLIFFKNIRGIAQKN